MDYLPQHGHKIRSHAKCLYIISVLDINMQKIGLFVDAAYLVFKII